MNALLGWFFFRGNRLGGFFLPTRRITRLGYSCLGLLGSRIVLNRFGLLGIGHMRLV